MATRRRMLLNLIRELGTEHLGELNLVLEALQLRPRARSEVIQSVLRMSGKSDRIPNPQLYLQIAMELGIIRESDATVRLTSLGQRLWNESTCPPYDTLNSLQKQTMAPELLGHSDLAGCIESAIRLFAPTDAGVKVLRPGSTSLGEQECVSLEVLQALQLASIDGDYLVIGADGLQQLRHILGQRAAQSEEELWQSQQEANKRARDAEEYVVQYEKRRLDRAGCSRLAESVERISKYDAKANYDVHSYEVDGDMRYIEVKSSTNLRVEFFWSLAERAFAQSKGTAYWIYFVPRSYELPNLQHGLVLIQNPFVLMGSQLSEEIAVYKVTLIDHIDDIQLGGAGTDSARVMRTETSEATLEQ